MPSPPLSIVQPLSPRVAVLASEDVTRACEDNGCRGLEELLRPWEGGTERVSVLSSTLTPTIHPTFPLRFVSFGSIFPNPALAAPFPDLVVDMIGSYVGARRPDEEQHYPLARSLLLSSRPVASYETFNHPVGILFAVSSSETDPINTMKRLVQQHVGVVQTIPWMDTVNLLKFFVVIHDNSQGGSDLSQANELLGSVKKLYGPHSTLLVINSLVNPSEPPPSPDVRTHPSLPLAHPLTPDNTSPSAISQIYASALASLTLSPMSAAAEAMGEAPISNTPSSPSQPVRRKLYGSKLNAEDTQRLAALVRELVVQSLIPWMEARVREWNEVYHANRRGITGRLFGAGRKLFGSRPASPSPNAITTGYNTAKGYYPVAAVETLTRRLADFAFMLRDYRFASGIYDSLRRDYAQDRAVRHSAAATEMYGLSLLLSNNYFLPSTPPRQPLSPFTTLQHTDISSWLEQAVLTYYGSGPGIQLDALRATLLYYEAWKMVGECRGVGAALVRAAGEAEEVVGAVMIEEAAQADLRGGKDPNGRGKRRRAFNLVTAGRRYETAGLKSYSRRCLTRAAEIYRTTPWTAVKDWIEYSLGRQAYASGEMADAVEHFMALLGRDDTGIEGSQAGPLEDMRLAYELQKVQGTIRLPVPIFDISKTRVATGSSSDSSSRNSEQLKLEEKALATWDRKGKKPMRLLPDGGKAVVNAGETFHIELLAINPLNAAIDLADLTVDISLSGSDSADITVDTIPLIQLEAYESRLIPIAISIPAPGTYTVGSATFLFHRFFPVTQALAKKGKRLHSTKAQRVAPTYGTDTSLNVQVVQGAPRITAELDWQGREETLVGEEVELALTIKNTGSVAVEEVQLFLNEPGMLRLAGISAASEGSSIENRLRNDAWLNLSELQLEPGAQQTVTAVFTGRAIGDTVIEGLIVCNAQNQPDEITCAPITTSMTIHGAVIITTRIRLVGEKGGYSVLVEAQNQSAEILQLDRLSPISQYWKASKLELDSVTLLPNQAYRMILPIYPPEVVPAGLDLYQSELIEGLSRLVQGITLSAPALQHAPFDLGIDTSNDIDMAAYKSSRTAYRIASLNALFPTLSSSQIAQLVPLIDPLDLDLILSYSIPQTTRKGHTNVHGLRPSPSFSLVRPIQREIASALASGSKQTRTMYEETGRLQRLLVDSIVEGSLALEDNPVSVRIWADGARKGLVSRSFENEVEKVDIMVELRNRSPALSARWILRRASNTLADAPSSSIPIYTGTMFRKGTLLPQTSEVVRFDVLVTDAGLMDINGLTLDVETGPRGEDEWEPLSSWLGLELRHRVQVERSHITVPASPVE